MKKFFQGITFILLKTFFCIICYVATIAFAFCSGYFTVIFYYEGYTGNSMLVVGLLAGLLEFVKTSFSISHPFMVGRNKSIEVLVKRILNVGLILSILASISFFLKSGNVEHSPPSQIISILYSYMPFLGIIPLQFVQFLATMSLSIFVEVLIIKVPRVAPVFFFEKSKREEILKENQYIDKVKEFTQNTKNKIFDKVSIFGKDKTIEPDEVPEVETNTVDLKKYRKSENLKAVNIASTKENNNELPSRNQLEKGISKITSNEMTEQVNNKESNKFNPQKIGFKRYEEIDLNLKPDTIKYLEYMYSNIRDEYYSPGKRDIKQNIGLKYKDIDLIWSQLERLGIIKVEKFRNTKRSKIIKDKNIAMELINKYFSNRQSENNN